MKKRLGFVSNSSSSSFCIGKSYMTEEQITKFREVIDEAEKLFIHTDVSEAKLYFVGIVDDHDSVTRNYLSEQNLGIYAAFSS